jgi:hypothetical protein
MGAAFNKEPSSYVLKNGKPSGEQLVYILDNYMYATRDFRGKDLMYYKVCAKSKAELKKKFGIADMSVYLAATFKSAKCSIGGKSCIVRFDATQSEHVKKINGQKQKSNGYGGGC